MGSAATADSNQTGTSNPESRGIFVVGAGRSGTSAIARALQALGVALGDNLKAPSDQNPSGFFEDRDLLRIAKAVRSQLGLRAESVALIPAEQWTRPDLQPFTDEAVETIHRRFVQYPVWGFKFAQTLRMLPFWTQVAKQAGIQLNFVVAARTPLSVAHSRIKLDPLRGVQEKTDLEWLVNVVPYFQQLGQYPFVVVDYDLLMAEPRQQLERLAQRLSIPLDAEVAAGIEEYAGTFLKPSTRHTAFDDADLETDPRLNPLTRDGYRWLRRLAEDKIEPNDPELWSDWERIKSQLLAMTPALRHVDYLEAEVRRLSGNRLRKTVSKLVWGR